ncbi:MAG: hypothetical protein PHG06_21250 [Parabacteroides sp.]|nr:hypothetical protein [Parabacteroides sp.]
MKSNCKVKDPIVGCRNCTSNSKHICKQADAKSKGVCRLTAPRLMMASWLLAEIPSGG